MQRLTEDIARVLGIILTILMAVMVIDVTWQVITRFILKDPSGFTEELAGFLLIWIGLLGASYAYYTKAHLGIDIVTFRLKGLKKQIIDVLINVIVLMFALIVMVYGGMRLVNITFTLRQLSPALGIEMGYIYLVIPVSGILVMYFAIHFIVQTIRSKSSESEEHVIRTVD